MDTITLELNSRRAKEIYN